MKQTKDHMKKKKLKYCECKRGNPIVWGSDIYCIQCGGEMTDKKAKAYLDKSL